MISLNITTDAFQSVSLNLDPSSIQVIHKAMSNYGCNIIKMEDTYYLKESEILIPLKELLKKPLSMRLLGRNKMRHHRISQLIHLIFTLEKIQQGDLNNSCTHPANIGGSYCRNKNEIIIDNKLSLSLTVRYLHQKVNTLEKILSKVLSTHTVNDI